MYLQYQYSFQIYSQYHYLIQVYQQYHYVSNLSSLSQSDSSLSTISLCFKFIFNITICFKLIKCSIKHIFISKHYHEKGFQRKIYQVTILMNNLQNRKIGKLNKLKQNNPTKKRIVLLYSFQGPTLSKCVPK